MDVRPVNSAASAAVQFADRGTAATPPAAAPVPSSVASVQPQALVQQPGPAAASAGVEQALAKINKALQQNQTGLEFSFDDQLRQTVVKVVDSQTGSIIRQMPTPEMLEIAKSIDQNLQSLRLRQQA